MADWRDRGGGPAVTMISRLALVARRHPNIILIASAVVIYWLFGKLSDRYAVYRYEHEWLLIEPPWKGISDFAPDLDAPTGEWTSVALCPSWIACQRFLKAEKECEAMGYDESNHISREFHEGVLAERCLSRADPEGPNERFDPQPRFEGCDPNRKFATKNCEPHKAASH